MSLDPQAEAFLYEAAVAGETPYHKLSVEDARRALEATLQKVKVELEPVAKIADKLIPSSDIKIPVRIYTPRGSGPFPVFVFFHGGGWVLGGIEMSDAFCRKVTNAVGCLVVSVDYRLAPENKFPIAVEDSYAATNWVFNNANTINANPEYIAVGGPSAGGNLAGAVSIMARDLGTPPLVYQVLLYPVTNYAFNTASYQKNDQGYFLEKEEMIWFWKLYLRSEADGDNAYASILRASNLRGLPPALIITAEYDPLLDEGAAYADRLQKAGVPTICTYYKSMIHGFLNMNFSQSEKGRQELYSTLKSAFFG